jgi:hypothetical protein
VCSDVLQKWKKMEKAHELRGASPRSLGLGAEQLDDPQVVVDCAQFCTHHQTLPSATGLRRNVSNPKFPLYLYR